jgi:hypothetical protein
MNAGWINSINSFVANMTFIINHLRRSFRSRLIAKSRRKVETQHAPLHAPDLGEVLTGGRCRLTLATDHSGKGAKVGVGGGQRFGDPPSGEVDSLNVSLSTGEFSLTGVPCGLTIRTTRRSMPEAPSRVPTNSFNASA